MGLFDEYESYLVKYQGIYGPKTIVLYQNGDFFEVYGVDNETEKVGLVGEFSNMTNIQLTRRSKDIIENNRSNFLMAGFPINQIDRYTAVLAEDNGYVVVVVEQITPPPKPKRGVTSIVSPGVNVRHLSHPQGNYLLSIYVENEGQKAHNYRSVNLLTLGLSAIDVSTGENIIYQVGNCLDDEDKAWHEAYRLIQTLHPKEIILHGQNQTIDIVSQLDIGYALIHQHTDTIPPEYRKLVFQNEFLGHVFKQTAMLKPIEYLNLERYPTATISYLLLLDFCHKQNETILDHIAIPKIWNDDRYMILENNCIEQLSLVTKNTQKLGSIFNLVDQTSTAMGKRLLKEKLLMPLVDPVQINQRFDYLEFFRDNERYLTYETHLKQVTDIERLHRRLSIGLLQPCELSQLDQSYHQVVKILDLYLTSPPRTSKPIISPDLYTQMTAYMSDYSGIIDLSESAKYTISGIGGSFFRKGYNAKIDQLQDNVTDLELYFTQLALKISSYIINTGSQVVNCEQSKDQGYYLELTCKRYETFSSACHEPLIIKTNGSKKTYIVDKSSFDVIKNRAGKTCKIFSPEIQQISALLTQTKEQLIHVVAEVYNTFQNEMYQKYSRLMTQLTTTVGLIDFYKSNAKTSLLYNYTRPQILADTDDGTGTVVNFDAQQLRHPLIERIQEKCQYVPQDISFTSSQQGILLFGVNCSGKSSLMKAIGISTILAQAGLYVPAKQLLLRPYHHVLTRILGNDNMYRGQSSFAVEMSELRGILKRAGPQTLVLGDEICHGTETISAVSLVTSAIITLTQSGGNFLFATHLHQLSQLKRVTDLKRVKMYHLKVKFDTATGTLIYDRHPEPGAGPPIYGLEVAKAMDLDQTFISLANEVRQEIMGLQDRVLLPKKSQYNTELYLNRCQIPSCSNTATLTHHIHFQSQANQHGFVEHIPINHKSNLITICQECHNKIHDPQPGGERYIIKGYVQTSSGPQLDLEIKTIPPSTQPLSPAPTPPPKRVLLLKSKK